MLSYFTSQPAVSSERCVSIFSAISDTEFIARLNQAFHRNLGMERQVSEVLRGNFDIVLPLIVSEVQEFLPNGDLPPIAARKEVFFIRSEREVGIREIRRGIEMSEERQWIFIPAYQLWIYSNFDSKGPSHVGTNPFLLRSLIQEFKVVEVFHTHPKLTTKNNWERYHHTSISLRFEEFALSSAFPSMDDSLSLFHSLPDLVNNSGAKITEHILHEFGMTSYSFQYFSYIDAMGEIKTLVPSIPNINLEAVLKSLRGENLSSSEKIRKIFQQIEEESRKMATPIKFSISADPSHLPDGALGKIEDLTDQTEPRLFLSLTD